MSYFVCYPTMWQSPWDTESPWNRKSMQYYRIVDYQSINLGYDVSVFVDGVACTVGIATTTIQCRVEGAVLVTSAVSLTVRRWRIGLFLVVQCCLSCDFWSIALHPAPSQMTVLDFICYKSFIDVHITWRLNDDSPRKEVWICSYWSKYR